ACDLRGRGALKRHHRHSDDIWTHVADESLDGLTYPRLNEDEVGDGDDMLRVDIAGKGREGPVRHADGDGRHVLERIWHREQEDVHRYLTACVRGAQNNSGSSESPTQHLAHHGLGKL